MGTIAALALLAMAALGWVAARFARARRYEYGCMARIAAWALGVAASIFGTWLVLRIDEYSWEAVPSALGLIVTVGLLYWMRVHAPPHPA